VQEGTRAKQANQQATVGVDDRVLQTEGPQGSASSPEPRARGGEPWSHRDIFSAVQRASEAAQIGRSIGVHTLRHTFATHAVASGVPLTPGIFDRLADGEVAERATAVSDQ
jgi:integrase